MKTLDEIINRQDYVRVNKALVERAKELCEKFANKFYELCGAWSWSCTKYPEHAVTVNGRTYCAKVGSMSGNSITSVVWVIVEDETWYNEADLLWRYKNRKPTMNYFDCVNFLNDAKEIARKLDEAESELVKDAEDAINNAKDIN